LVDNNILPGKFAPDVAFAVRTRSLMCQECQYLQVFCVTDNGQAMVFFLQSLANVSSASVLESKVAYEIQETKSGDSENIEACVTLCVRSFTCALVCINVCVLARAW
jgi:hypothetical protein